MSQSAGTPSDTPAAASAVRLARRKDIALRVLQVILGLFFAIASAAPKLVAQSAAVESFEEIGFGMWFMYAIGVLELLGGIALMTPWLSGLSAIALIGLMIGAFITQLAVFDGEYAITPLLFMIPLAIIAWGRRGTVTELAARLRAGS